MLPRLRSMSESVRVPDQVRLRLAHGVLEHLAGSVGAPVLHVKGVALHPGLAAGRGRSTDCDLLVAPMPSTASSVPWNGRAGSR